jgi:tetratricopeptide (TPR) repeat protein
MPGVITGLLGKAAVELGKRGYKKLTEETFLTKAIEDTAGAFPYIEASQSLITWSKSEHFNTLIESLKAGDRNLTDNTVINSFVQIGGFYMGSDEETHAVSQEIVTEFVKNLEREIYNSPGGISALANRAEVLQEETLDAVQQSQQEVMSHMTNEISSLKDLLLKNSLSTDGASRSQDVKEQLLNARVDVARDVLNENRASTARTLLLRLRNENPEESISPELRFRIANTLGACALQLDELAEAKEEFKKALTFQPNDHRALGNAAAAALLAGDFDEALDLSQQARSKSERDTQANAVYLQSLHNLGRSEEVAQFIESEVWIRDEPFFDLVLGLISCDNGDYDAAVTHVRRALEAEKDNFHAFMLLTAALFEPINQRFQFDPPLPWRVKTEVKRHIEEADDAATGTINILEKHDNRKQLHHALTNRAAIRTLLGYFDEAIKDCDRVLLEDESNAFALRHKGMALMKQGEYAEAATVFERILDESHLKETTLLRAAAYSNADQAGRAVELLAPLWNPRATNHSQILIAEVLLNAYSKLDDKRAADGVWQELRRRWRDDSEAILIVSRRLRYEDKPAEAKEVLRQALLRPLTENQRDRITLDLADVHFGEKEWSEAARYYESVINKDADLPKVQAYAASLFNSGKYPEALAFSRSVREDKGPLAMVTEVEANVLEYVNDLDPAINLRLKLSRVEPQNPFHLIRVFMLEFRRGNTEAARAAIDQVDHNTIKDNARALVHVAEAYLLLGRYSDALPLAYRARHLGPHDPNIHLAYQRIFLSCEREFGDKLSPIEVALDCTVHLSRGNEREVVTIVEVQPGESKQGEIAPTDHLAQRLLGHSKGDTVVIKDTELEKLSYTISDVQSKYVFAFQETFLKFGTWFPENESINRVEIADDDFSLMFKLLDERYTHASYVMSLYNENRLPLAMLASVLRRPRRVVWEGLITVPEGKIFAGSGDEHDIQRRNEAIKGATVITLDLSGLLTLEHLGLTDRLPTQFTEILIPQAVLDEINQDLVNESLGSQKKGSLARTGVGYTLLETTAEELTQQLAFLGSLRDFVISKTKVVPAKGALELDKEKFERLNEMLGEGGIASILVAQEHGTLLYSDDLGLSSLARNDHGVESVWTQTILIRMLESKIITEDEYHDATRKLLLANYFHTYISIDDIKWVLQRDSFSLTGDVTHVMGFLKGPGPNEDAAVEVTAELIKFVWAQTSVDRQRWLFLDFALNTLMSGREIGRTLMKLKRRLQSKFLILLGLPSVLQSIDAWQQQASRARSSGL